MAIECKFCGGPHPFWECRKAPEGWKPARDDTPLITSVMSKHATVIAASGQEVTVHDANGTRTLKRGRPISDTPKSKRAEYQRELMRKRRAMARAQRPPD